MSPTYSQMINIISLSDEDFEINKDLLRKDFYFEANKERKDWFFSTVPKDIRTLYQEEFYAYLRQESLNFSNKRNIQTIPISVLITLLQKLRYGKQVTTLS